MLETGNKNKIKHIKLCNIIFLYDSVIKTGLLIHEYRY